MPFKVILEITRQSYSGNNPLPFAKLSVLLQLRKAVQGYCRTLRLCDNYVIYVGIVHVAYIRAYVLRLMRLDDQKTSVFFCAKCKPNYIRTNADYVEFSAK